MTSGASSVAAATPEVGARSSGRSGSWEGGPGAVSLGLGLSPFEQDRQIGAKIDAVHDRLEDEWGTQTDSKVYRGVLLAGLLVPSHSERRGVEGIAGAVGSSAGAVGKHQAQQGHSTPLPRTVADLPPAPAGSTAQTWGQVGTLDYHAKKHGSDLGWQTGIDMRWEPTSSGAERATRTSR